MGAINRYSSDNVVVGNNALAYHGAQCVAIGGSALHGDVTYGGSAAAANHTGSVAVGYQAGASTTGSYNTLMGYKAGKGSGGSSGEHNVAVGSTALQAFTTGIQNVAVGSRAMSVHTTGTGNTVIGDGAMRDTDAGSDSLDSDFNVFIGWAAGGGAWVNAKSEFNTFVGSSTCVASLDNALYNAGLGYRAGEALTSGDANTIMGGISGHSLNSGTGNTLVGYNVASSLTTGHYNTIIGKDANVSNAGVSDEILIKAGVDTLTGGGTETVRIGVDSDYITNDFGENATWTHSSDRRIKIDIKDNTLGLDFINKLKTRNFKKKAPSEYPEEFEQHNPDTTERKNPDRIHYGFVAQEVKEAMDLVGHSEFPVWKENRDGMQELGETELITPLVKAVQELTEKNERLQNKINDLEIFIMDKLGDE